MKKRALFLMGQLCLCLTLSIAVGAQNNSQAPVQTTQQESGTIAGIVLDSANNLPIEFATVALLVKGNSQPVSGTLTDKQGRFTFNALQEGTYELAISFMGYESKTVGPIALSAGKATGPISRVLLKPARIELKEVTVQSLRPTIIQEADKMIVSVEGTALAAGSTAYEVLARAPGVFIDQEGNIQLNGKAGVTIMLDGKLTYLSARDLRTMLEGMPAENLKNIEIITNPSAKYDAEGTSGILNINLKKNELRGVNGSVYGGANYNGMYGYNGGATVNYKEGKWNSFVNLDMARRVWGREATFTRIFRSSEETTFFDQVATEDGIRYAPASRFGTEYSFNKQHSLGITGTVTTQQISSQFLTDTYIGNAPGQPNLYVNADNYNSSRFSNYASNMHYAGAFDTAGTTLTADLDWVQIRNRTEGNFYNYYHTLGGEGQVIQDFLYNDIPSGFDIYAAKLDFTRPFSKKNKLELGAKASRVISDNDMRFYFVNDDALTPDPKRSNQFLYHETIWAGYANLKGNISERVSIQAGLRAEQTIATGRSVTLIHSTDRNYLSLFPSLFVKQDVHDNYQVNYSYSRRIQRPNYGQLNPFLFYRDPYTWILGNPGLRPQFTNAFGITQTFKSKYNLILNYQLSSDVIAELPSIDEEAATTVYYTGNVDQSQNISVTGVAPIKFAKSWEANNTLVVAYNRINAMVNKEPVVNDQLFYMLQTNQTIALPKNTRLEVNGTYRGPAASGLYRIAPMWWVNLGVKKSFMDKKLDLSLSVNDIFKSQRLIFEAIVGGDNVNDFNQYFRSRSVAITLRYHFSKGSTFDAKKRNNNLDELNRTGG